MQYLLSAEEMAEIRAERAAIEQLPGGGKDLKERLEAVCKHVATTMVPTVPFNDYTVGKPYGCIHVDRRESFGYCDKCPVQDICPMPKSWSK